jgi:hypothetical protein
MRLFHKKYTNLTGQTFWMTDKYFISRDGLAKYRVLKEHVKQAVNNLSHLYSTIQTDTLWFLFGKNTYHWHIRKGFSGSVSVGLCHKFSKEHVDMIEAWANG